VAVATSYNVTSVQGARENLENLLRVVEPQTTPLYATLKQGAAPKAVLNEWLTDTLSDPEIGGVEDALDLTFGAASTDFTDQINARVRFGNRVQTIRRAYAVSRQAQLIDVAPGENLLAASKAKSLIELKRDIETAIGGGNDQVAGASGTAATLAGLGTWTEPLSSTSGNTFNSAAKVTMSSVTNSRYDFTSAGTLTEANLRSVIQAVYEASGSKTDYRLFSGPAVVNAVTDFSRAAVSNAAYNFEQDVGGGKLRLSVVEFVSDYGLIKVIPDLFLGRVNGSASSPDTAEGTLNSNRAYLIPGDDTVQLKFLESITSENLPDLAGGPRAFVEAMLTLCVANPRALGSIV